jgi:signal transduction histidine kinase
MKTQKREKMKNRFKSYRWRKKNSTSIYFLLWAIFAALSFLVMSVASISQRVILSQSYKQEASREVTEKGRQVKGVLSHDVPEWTGGNYSGFLRFLSQTYDVRIYILTESGEVLFPQEENFNPGAPELQEGIGLTEEMDVLLDALERSEESYAVHDSGDEYVYITKIPMYQDSSTYLYVGKSLILLQMSISRMNMRVGLVFIFLLVLSFAISSAVAGWLAKPLSEMTDKAWLLAQGDFDVDFYGTGYGKEMAQLAESLNFARDELSKTDRMQKELIANVSHDFKTPLTMIKAYASMIMEISGDIPEKRNKHAQVIVDEADRLTSLVGDVLDLSKIRSGIDVLKKTDLDMSAYVYETLDRFSYFKDDHGYSFVMDIDEGLYTCVDEQKIGQVLYNLIGNAVNYTGADKRVYVRLKKESNEYFRFSVTDTGKGIKPEELPNIWERYYRSSEMHKRPVKGTGLGLSIVKTILQKHELAFGVDSEVGKGSTFYVIFPCSAEKEENAPINA